MSKRPSLARYGIGAGFGVDDGLASSILHERKVFERDIRLGRLMLLDGLSYEKAAKRCGVTTNVAVRLLRRIAPHVAAKRSAAHRERMERDGSIKLREKARRYYARHRAKVLEKLRSKYASDGVMRAVLAERCRRYYRKNRERILAQERARRLKHAS